MNEDARIFAPAAARNVQFIVEALCEIAPDAKEALEIASGSGEHAIAIARALPGVLWRPTDIDPAKLASIDAWAAHAKAANIAAATSFNAATEVWGGPKVDLAFAANILHLIPAEAARAVIKTMASALAPNGIIEFAVPI
ncbi:MAG: DUF938 domain-containing protein [Pseudomonadota bacterium]